MQELYSWHYAVQEMIDRIETHLTDEPTLDKLAQQCGYSKFYCSAQFRSIAGMTIKKYIAGRRLCAATLAIRDTRKRILDIAVEYGYFFPEHSDESVQGSLWMYAGSISEKPPLHSAVHSKSRVESFPLYCERGSSNERKRFDNAANMDRAHSGA